MLCLYESTVDVRVNFAVVLETEFLIIAVEVCTIRLAHARGMAFQGPVV